MSISVRSDMEFTDRPFQFQLLGLLGFGLISHLSEFPWWVSGMCGLALFYKSLHLRFDFRLPSKWLLYTVSGAYSLAIFLHYRTVFGAEAASPLIALLTSVKILETNRDRDARFVVVACLFLIMTHLLVDQSLVSTLYMTLGLAYAVYLLSLMQQSNRSFDWKITRRVARDLVLTLPLWGILFFVIPRFSVGFNRSAQQKAKVGFSGGIGGVQIDQLVESKQPVFRARFADSSVGAEGVSTSQLYWRGATLLSGEGLNWEPMPVTTNRTLSTLRSGSEVSSPSAEMTNVATRTYTIRFFDQQAESVLFSLGEPLSVLSEGPEQTLRVLGDSTIRAVGPLSSQMDYQVSSESSDVALKQQLNREELELSKTRVEPLSPALQKLIFDLSQRRAAANVISTIEVIEEFFRSEGFRYTLRFKGPAPKSVTDFLLRNRQGFCEHYAAGAAVLLRELGYPTRVVVGYQGGKWNPLTESVVVRERDAHAWVEVYSGTKWIRFDPTAAVSPLRITVGADMYDLDDDELFLLSQKDISQQRSELSSLSVLGRLELIWDFAQFGWERFLLSYDRSSQMRWLEELVMLFPTGDIRQSIKSVVKTTILIIVLALIVGFGVLLLTKHRERRDLSLQYQLLRQAIESAGIPFRMTDGPFTLAKNIEQAIPQARASAVLFRLSEFYFSGERDRMGARELKGTLRELALRTAQARKEFKELSSAPEFIRKPK